MTETIQKIDEPYVQFKLNSDLGVYKIVNEDIKETLIEITGYDLQINFNMKYLNSIQDVETACNGVADLFREIILEKLLENKKQS